MKTKYKILIADDEYWVRKKLTSLLDWEAYGLECLEPTKDGLETLERIRAEKPDILVTDINMPFLNGVELLERVHQEQPEIVPFVVSGYDDFEYVKGSFLSGGINYLLKPVSREELAGAVSKALEIIAIREDQQRKSRKAASALRDNEFSQLVRDRETTALPTGSMNKYIGMTRMSLMLVRIHNLQTVTRQYDYDLTEYSYRIKENILALAGREDLVIFNYTYRAEEFIILSELSREESLELAAKIRALFSRYDDVRLTICVTPNAYSIEQIHDAYRDAVEHRLPEDREAPADTTRYIIRQAAAYIDENYSEDLTLSSLAERFNVESSYFSRVFRQEMGENVIYYITKKRIEKAQAYIAGSDTNLTEIAFQVGYNDYSYFNRVFKKHTGMSPREYRNRVGREEEQDG